MPSDADFCIYGHYIYKVMGKYLRRALKFYVFLLVLITLVILLLALVGFADLTNINTLFRNGFNAVWEIALIFLAVALIYPKIGFSNRNTNIRACSWDEARTNMMIALGERGYKLESEDGKVFTFRKKWFVNRLAKYTEDRITITLVSGFDADEAPEEQAGGEESKDVGQESGNDKGGEAGRLNRYTVNIEGLTKDIVRIVSALYRVQSQNTDE